MTIGVCSPINPAFLREFLVSDNIPDINGGASAVNTYVKELLRNGHKVIVFTSVVPSSERKNRILKGDHLEVHIIHSNPGIFISHALSRFYMIKRIRNYIRPYLDRLDVLHAQWSYDFAYASISFSSTIPVFCTVRDWAPRIFNMQKGLKKIQWWYYTMLSNKVLHHKNIHLIANSSYIKECLEGIGIHREISLIGNPVSSDIILVKKEKIVEPYTYISIANGAGAPWKNIRCLLLAFQIVRKKNNTYILKLAGNSFYEDDPFIRMMKEEGLLNGVKLLGQLSRSDLFKEIDTSSCLVHPSLEESFGNIFLEGMARCVPVIGGYSSGAVPTLLGHGEYGFLCDVTNPTKLAELMLYVADTSNKSVVTNVTAKASKYLQENYLDTKILNKHLLLYGKYINS